MAKKKKNLSEMKSKRETGKKGVNPFEMHINKQKFQVLGRQLKNDRGLPGVAKARALRKRKETLLQEYKVINKSNKFFDRRIGENNSSMTNEDRIIARFSAERMKFHKKKDIFNLADDEVLTHKGQSIAEIDKFEDPMSDEDDGEVKGLNANFVEEANFGGGVLKESKNNRAAIIDQLIAESKKRKAERQLAKERTLQKTEELDAEWKELIPIVNMGKQDVDIEKKDSYDIVVNELKFEPRGTPSDKLKSESDIAEEEARKLKELEEERLRRMRGDEPPMQIQSQHRSADDLDDGFEIEEESFELLYDKDGNPINPDKIEAMKRENKSITNENESEEDIDDDDVVEEEEEEEEGDEEQDGDDGKGRNDEIDDDENADSDDLSDLQVNDDEGRNSDSEVELEDSKENQKLTSCNRENVDSKASSDVDKGILKVKGKKVSFGQDSVVEYSLLTDIKKTEEMEKEREERSKDTEKARNELPYFFEVPKTYEELKELLEKRTHNEQAVIISRMMKCNHPSLSEKNKEKMETLFALLMQYLNDAGCCESWALLDRIAPFLFDLAQFSPGNAGYCLTEVILEKHSDYLKKKNKYPPPEALLFLKLVPLLFPTSDKRHSVTTPAFIFISEVLRFCQVTTRRAIASGLFLASLFTEYVWLSKRIMPEVFNFLCGVLSMATPATNIPVIPPFKKEHKYLFLHDSHANQNDLRLSMCGSDLELKSGLRIDTSFRIRSIHCTLKLLEVLTRIYDELPACRLLFEPLQKHLQVLEINKYPKAVQLVYNELSHRLSNIMNRELTSIIMEAKKPKALRLYEPSIEPVYDMKKSKLPADKAEHSKLLYKYKKEMKSAIREIRRDREFISKIKFKERSASDAERKRKVKEIYSWGAIQESEIKKMKRKKK